MGENRSLDEFFPASDDADGDESEDADGTDDVDVGGSDSVDATTDADSGAAVDADGVSMDDAVDATTDASGDDAEAATDEAEGSDEGTDLPRATYRWSPDGDDCPACGSAVERQWRDGDRFVCADCKEW